MSPFDNMPRELVDHIVDIVLVHDRDVPSADIVDIDKARITHERDRNSFRAWDYGPENVLWENTTYISNAAPLLLVNRAFYDATKDAVERLASSEEGLVYKLDVMFVHEREIWPTWIRVPTLATVVRKVEVTLHIVGSHETARAASNNRRVRSGLIGGCGGPVQLLWCFYYLMEHFLKCGPRSHKHGDGDIVDHSVVTRRMEVNIPRYKGPLGPPPETTLRSAWWGSRDSNEQDLAIHAQPMRPEWLMYFLLRDFAPLLDMGYHTAEYGAIIYERVGWIQFSAEGDDHDDPQKLRHEYNLGEMLKKIDHDDPGNTFGNIAEREERVPKFKAWKKHTMQQRQHYRLEVAADRVEPEVTNWLARIDML